MSQFPTQHRVLCFTGSRNINKRMILFIEGVLGRGMSVRICSLPRGQWRLDKSERSLQPVSQHRLSMVLGSSAPSTLGAIMCFHWFLLPLAVITGWWQRVPVLYDEHDHYELNTLEGGGSRWRQTFFSRMVRCIHRYCLPRVSLVTCIHMNASTLKKHLEQWQSAILEVHNYPTRQWRTAARRNDGTYRLCFVYIGGVFREKGPAAAAAAFQLLTRDEQQRAELHIFGDGDAGLIETLQRTPGVTVHHAVTPDEFRCFAADHRCCGLSLLANTPRYRLVGTNCTKLYEYLALGMPVIATRVGEFPQFILEHNVGLIVDGEMRPAELVVAMQTLLGEEAVYFQMSQNAKTLMNRDDMTWESEWKKVEQSGVFDVLQRAA
jgi:glycosyltransferase involved in cell wall biosynthesis